MASAGCGPGVPLNVTTLQLGRSLNSDDSIAAHATRFKPDETVHVAVITDNVASGTITARWSFRGRMVSQEDKKVSYRDLAATEFRLHYAGGFPAGEYTVEIEVDGMPAGSRDFVIEN